jgi:hypothetical protein
LPDGHAEAVRVISSGIDWITATAPKGTKGTLLALSAHRWRDEHEQEGHHVKTWEWNGYQGSTMDSISVGERHDGTIVRLAGELAKTRGARVIDLASHVSRLDVQVTTMEREPWRNHALTARHVASLDRRVSSGMCALTYVDSGPRGVTVYIGSRSHTRFYRIYDKSAESHGLHPVGTWRFEVEYKGDRAGRVGEELRRCNATAEACRSIVDGAFRDYGIGLPCGPLPRNWRDTSPREETNDEKRLKWLETTIAPAIERLIESYDLPTVIESLGLGEYWMGVLPSNTADKEATE